MGSPMVGLGRGGAGGVVQFFDKVGDVPVVALGTFVTCLLGFVWVFTCSSLVSRSSMTCLLGVVELFVLVKGVGDVLAGRLSRWVSSWGPVLDKVVDVPVLCSALTRWSMSLLFRSVGRRGRV